MMVDESCALQQSYSLNLSPRYAPNWTAWEVAREIICNAIDADPEGMQVHTNGTDELTVRTNTVPELGELFIIGQGSKAPGGTAIGQFGEGLKMAALVASRALGGSLTLSVPGKTITFGFKQVMGADVLHAFIEPNLIAGEGYEATIRMTGIGLSFAGRILPDRVEGPFAKTTPDSLRVYCKGVYIADLDLKTIWDWNLNGLSINRDRSMVDKWSVVSAVANWLERNMDVAIADELIDRPTLFESGQPLALIYSRSARQALREAFFRRHGESAVIGVDKSEFNNAAKSRGFQVVHVSNEMGTLLHSEGVKTSEDVTPNDHEFEPVDCAPYTEQIARLRSLDSIVGAPNFQLSVFANHQEAVMGLTNLGDYRVWLNEVLFSTGQELDLVRTYLHEVGHIMSRAKDATLAFEHSLDGIAGRLALAFLGVVAEVSK